MSSPPPIFQQLDATTTILKDVVQSLMDSGIGVSMLGVNDALGCSPPFWITAHSNKLATGRFAGSAERRTARALGRLQQKQRQTAKVALKAGSLDIPQAQQSVVVAGAPDFRKKTYSIIDPAISIPPLPRDCLYWCMTSKEANSKPMPPGRPARAIESMSLLQGNPTQASSIPSTFSKMKPTH